MAYGTREHEQEDGTVVECDNGRIDNGIAWRECPWCAEEAEDAAWEAAEARAEEARLEAGFGC